MLQVQIKETYATILQPLPENVDKALHQYALEKVQVRLGDNIYRHSQTGDVPVPDNLSWYLVD